MENQEVTLTVGKTALPQDIITYKDPIYGERVFVRQGEVYKEETKAPVSPVRVHSDRSYTMNESSSFVDAVKKYGNPETGIIFYEGQHGQNNMGITMFFEEYSRKESIRLPLATSLEFRAFLGGKEKSFDQKALLKVIDTYPECIQSAALLRPMVEKIQLSTEIEFESNLDSENLTFIYKEKTGGNQVGRLPKKLTLVLPFYEGSDNKVTIEADLEVTMPKEEGAKPAFKLSNVKHERTERDALKSEIATLQSNLVGWLFVNGH